MRIEVLRAVTELTEPYRQTVALRYFEGLPPREIAQLMKVPVATVRTRTQRGIALLRDGLDRRFGGRESWCAILLPTLALQSLTTLGGATAAAPALSSSTISGALIVSGKLKIVLASLILVTLGFGVWKIGFREDDSRLETQTIEETADATTSARRQAASKTGEAEVSELGAAEVESLGDAPHAPVEESPIPKPAPGEGRLELTVVHHDGTPAKLLPVRILPFGVRDPFFRERTFDTDERGQIILASWASSRSLVTTSLGGYMRIEIKPGETTVETFVIPEGTHLKGLVVHPDGRPAAHAEIVTADFGHPVKGGPVCRADAEGRFDIPSFSTDGMGLVGARLEGFAPSPMVMVRKSVGNLTELRLELGGEAAQLEVTFIDPEGKPAGPTRVEASHPDFDQFGLPDGNRAMGSTGAEMMTGEDGTLRFPWLRPGTLELEARTFGYAAHTETLTLRAGETRRLRVMFKKGGTVRGLVVDEKDQPLKGVEVTLGRYGTLRGHYLRTKEDGVFYFEDVQPGKLKLRLELSKVGNLEDEITVLADQVATWKGQITKHPAISGRVTDEAGNPLVGRSVSASAMIVKGGQVFGSHGSSFTNASGEFTIEGLEGKYPHAVKVQSKSGIISLAKMEGVEPGGSPVHLVVPSALAGEGNIKGRIVQTDGSPVANANVTLFHENGDGTRLKGSNPDGTFEYKDLIPGVYRLRVHAADFGYQEFEGFVVKRDEEVDIGDVRLAAGGQIEIVLDGPATLLEGRKLEVFARSLSEKTNVSIRIRELTTLSQPLAPGRYRLSLQSKGLVDASIVVEVEAGVRQSVTMPLRPGRAISVSLSCDAESPSPARYRVTDAAGRLIREGSWWGWPSKPRPLTMGVGEDLRVIEIEDEDGRKARGTLGPMTPDALTLTLR
jgi:sigma-70-like protein/carboxypeptidase family protein